MSVRLGSVSPRTRLTWEPLPYDVRLCRLGQSPVIALTSADLRLVVFPAFYVSLVSGCPVASRAQIRGQIWFREQNGEWAKGERPDMIAVQEGDGTRAS